MSNHISFIKLLDDNENIFFYFRFKNPVPADNWNGIRQATTFGNVCPQLKNGKVIGNEDCLFLNVYSPLLKFNSLLVEILHFKISLN